MQLKRQLILVAVLALATLALFAQATTGAFVGNVTDESGGVVPGVTIVAVDTSTGFTRSAVSGNGGEYVISGLPVGSYDVTAELPGFRPAVHRGVVLRIQSEVRLNFTLRVGELTDQVYVESAPPVIETEKTSVEQRTLGEQIARLPLNNRSAVELMLSNTAGVNLDGNFWHPVWPTFNVSGARRDGINFQVEGKTAMWSLQNTQTTAPPLDSIAEFTVQTSSVSADKGMGLVQVQQAIKQGTNEFHGSLYHYYRGSVWDARDAFNPGDPPNLVRNNFGFSVGGPIIKDRTFFFTNSEWMRLREAVGLRLTHPTALQRSGDFSEFGGQLIDPMTGDPFPNNVIPRERWHPASVVFDQFIPEPTLPGATANVFALRPQPQNNNTYLLRLDHELNANHRLMGLARLMYYDEFNWATSVHAGSYWIKHAGRDFTLRHDWTINPVALNQLTVGTNLMYETVENENKDRDVLRESGLGGFWHPDFTAAQGGFIDLIMQGYSRVSETTSPRSSHEFSNTVANDFSYVRGGHTFKIGASVNWGETEVRGRGVPIRPRFDFRPTFTGHSYGDFLLGLPTQATILRGVLPARLERAYYTAYFQNNWRLSPQLNLNLGVRYELHGVQTEKNGRMSIYDFERSGIIVSSMNAVRQDWIDTGIPIRTAAEAGLPEGLRRGDHNNFAPRIGFAYRLTPQGTTVLRGGYGTYFFPYRMASWPIGGFNNPPFASNISFVNTDPSNPLTYEGMEVLAGVLGTASIFGIDPNYKDAVVHQGNLTLEKDLGWETGLRISYVGTRSTNLQVSPNVNQPRTVQDPVTGNPAFQRLDPRFGNISVYSAAGSGWYNAMELEVNRRFRDNLSFQTNWTWAKNLSEVEYDVSAPQDSFDLKNDYADTGFVRRHHVKANFIWELPFGSGQRWLQDGFVSQVFGGWAFSGSGRWGTGRRFDPRFSASADADLRAGRPDLVPGCDPNNGPKTAQQWFDVSCFTVPTTQAGLPPSLRFGNAGRNLVVGPGFRQMDLSLQKSWQLPMEEVKLTFRLDAYNAFNHANLGNPNTTLGLATSGQIFSTFGSQRMSSARQTQFGLRIDF